MSTTVGIDLGSDSLKGIVLRSSGKSGPIEVVAAGTLPISELCNLEDSPDKTLAIGVKLKELVRSARLRGNTRRIGAAGKNTTLRYLQTPPVPPWRRDMLVKYEVEERAGDKDTNAYDYHILDIPDTGGQDTVLIGMMKESAAYELMALAKNAGLGGIEIDFESLALFNAYFHGHGFDSDKTVLVVDIGADDLTVLICKNGSLYFARTMMGGGRRFTQVLAEELKVELAEAEQIKRTEAEISFDLPGGTTNTARIPRRMPGQTGVMRSGATAMMTRPGARPADESAKAADAKPGELIAPKPSDTLSRSETAPSLVPEIELPSLDDTLSFPSIEGLEPAAVASPSPSPALELVSPTEEYKKGFVPEAPKPAVGSTDDKRRRQISAALIKEAASVCAALESAMVVAKQTTRVREIKVDRVYLTGGGSKLKGLGEFISRRMRAEVQPLEPLRQLSLQNLPLEQAEALKKEQYTLAVAIGLAVANLRDGAFGFLMLPETTKQRNIFWARGAYLYYAAALALVALSLLLFTPFRNSRALAENFKRANDAVGTAQDRASELKKLEKENEERRQQIRQIETNTQSGHFFLNLLAELKNSKLYRYREHDPRTGRETGKEKEIDLYLTSISTNMPVVAKKTINSAGAGGGTPGAANQTSSGADSTFQTQRVIYLRGFIRSAGEGTERLIDLNEFYKKLVPFPDEPDNPANLFKDVKAIWYGRDQKEGKYYLTEFVLEAYTEGTRDSLTKKETRPKPAAPAAPVAPAALPAVEAPLVPAPAPLNPAPLATEQVAPVAPQPQAGQTVLPPPVAPLPVAPVAPVVPPVTKVGLPPPPPAPAPVIKNPAINKPRPLAPAAEEPAPKPRKFVAPPRPGQE